MLKVNTMLNCAFSVFYEISCVFGMQYPFKLWNMFFIISDHRGGKNVNISLQTSHEGQFDDDSCCHSAFITFQYSLVMNVIVNLPGDTDNLLAKYKSTLR